MYSAHITGIIMIIGCGWSLSQASLNITHLIVVLAMTRTWLVSTSDLRLPSLLCVRFFFVHSPSYRIADQYRIYRSVTMVTDMQCCPLDTNRFYRLSLAIVRRVWLSVCFQFDISIGENGESSGRSGGIRLQVLLWLGWQNFRELATGNQGYGYENYCVISIYALLRWL